MAARSRPLVAARAADARPVLHAIGPRRPAQRLLLRRERLRSRSGPSRVSTRGRRQRNCWPERALRSHRYLAFFRGRVRHALGERRAQESDRRGPRPARGIRRPRLRIHADADQGPWRPRPAHLQGAPRPVEPLQPAADHGAALQYADPTIDVSVGDLLGSKELRETYFGLGVSHRSGIFGMAQIFDNVNGGSNFIYTYVEWRM